MIMINFLLEINKETLSGELNIKFPLSNNINSLQILDDLKNNKYIHKDSNNDSQTINNKTSINLFKNNILEKQIIQGFNKQKSILINKQSTLKKEYKPLFKDISSSFLSPYGGHVPRAPDESLEACNTKACYE